MVYKVCLHGYARVNKWSTKFVYIVYTRINNMDMFLRGLFTWIYTNKQMGYEVCLHGYTRINKWINMFVYMGIHQ